MHKDIKFHAIENDPQQWYIHSIYIFDRGGRRHVLGLSRVEGEDNKTRLLVRHLLVRKDIPTGPLEFTSLAGDDLKTPENNVAFLDHLVADPLLLGTHISEFLRQHFHQVASHTGCSAHERLNLKSAYLDNLKNALRERRRASTARRKARVTARAAGILLPCDLRDGRLLRLCPEQHSNFVPEAIETTFRIIRAPRARKYSLMAVEGPLKGQRFIPPGGHYLAVEAEDG